MSGAAIQAHVYRGYGIAAAHLGGTVTQYRPSGGGSPIVSGNIVGTLVAAFTTDAAFGFKAPSKWGKQDFFGLFDATSVHVGDYLVGPTQTLFVASLESLTPPLCVLCNEVLTLTRPAGGTLAGSNAPGGDSLTTETTLLTTWPAAAVTGGRADRGDVELPGDIRMGGWQVYLPLTPGVTIRGGDILTDATGLRRIVSAAEPSARGWRMIVLQEAA